MLICVWGAGWPSIIAIHCNPHLSTVGEFVELRSTALLIAEELMQGDL